MAELTSPEMVEELLPIVPDSPAVEVRQVDVLLEDPLGKERKMAPPPLPVTIHAPTPNVLTPGPKMTRLPSLQQLSHHLHIPSPSSTQSTPPLEHVSPPQLSLSTTPAALASPAASAGTASSSPFAASPSSRLRLPPSAMMRSLSSTSVPTISKARRLSESINANDLAVSSPTASNSNSPAAKGAADPFKVDAAAPLSSIQQNTPPVSSAALKRQPSREYVQGYKDVPSLAAIRDRVRGMSISAPIKDEVVSPKDMGSVKVKPVPEGKENASPVIREATPASATSSEASQEKFGKEHPLTHAWTIFFDSKTYKPDPNAVAADGAPLTDYEKSLLTVGRFETVEGFARHMNNLRLPSGLNRNSNYHMFKKGIRPMWEDPANANGGKWVILFRGAQQLLDAAWANLTMALVGEVLDPENSVCGIVASNRPKIDRIQIWTRGREDVSALNAVGQRAWDLMGLEPGEAGSVSIEFQYNSDAHPPYNTFFHVPFASNRPASFAAPSMTTPARTNVMGPPATPAHGLPANPRSLTVSTSSSSVGNQNLAPPTSSMHYPLPATPDRATIQAAVSPGAAGMRRTLSAQSANGSNAFGAFGGPVGAMSKPRALSPRVSNSILPALSPSIAQ